MPLGFGDGPYLQDCIIHLRANISQLMKDTFPFAICCFLDRKKRITNKERKMKSKASILFDMSVALGSEMKNSISSIANQSIKEIEIILGYYGTVIPNTDYVFSVCKYPIKIKYVNLSSSNTKADALKKMIEQSESDLIFFNHNGVCYSFDFIRKVLDSYEDERKVFLSKEILKGENGEKYIINNSVASRQGIVINIEDVFLHYLRDCPELMDYENRGYRKEAVLGYISEIKNDTIEQSADTVLFYFALREILEKKKIALIDNIYITKKSSIFLENANEIWKKISICKNTLKTVDNSDHLLDIQKIEFKENDYCKIKFDNYNLDCLKKMILEHEIISFDIYDTLLIRPLWRPEDLFYILQNIISKEFSSADFIDFRSMRIEAEHMAREKAINGEVFLDDIYTSLATLTGFNDERLQEIKQKELKLEYDLTYQRITGKEIYDFAVWAKKRIILTSDMYLPKEFILSLLEKNGYSVPNNFFLSAEQKQTKSGYGLYQIIEQNFPNSKILHIGDNYQTDYLNCRTMGIDSFHLPKCTNMMNNESSLSSFFNMVYSNNIGMYNSPYIFNTDTGMRVLWAVVANKLFDNPYQNFKRDTMFNSDPYWMGASVGGLFTWTLIKEIKKREQEYDSIVFVARDGFLLNKCMTKISSSEKYKYCRISRKSLFPLCVSKSEGLQIKNIGLVNNVSPYDVYKLINRILSCNEIEFDEFCKINGKEKDEKFESLREFSIFGSKLVDKYFDEQKYEDYKAIIYSYLSKFFVGKSLLVDMGYSGRVESILTSAFGFQIESLYIHTKEDSINTRALAKNLCINSIIPFSPVENIWLRELLNSELIGSCIAYKAVNSITQPVLDSCVYTNREKSIIESFQTGVEDFVVYINTVFGKYLDSFSFNSYDGVFPFEFFLTNMSEDDKKTFEPCFFEDDLGVGKKSSMDSLFNYIPKTFPSVKEIAFPSKKCETVYNVLCRRDLIKKTFRSKHSKKWYFKPLRQLYRICRKVKRVIFS